MDLLAQWMTSKGSWHCGEFSDLPVPGRDASPALQQWTIVAGGLALILSRASPTEASERFPASLQLYDLLRDGLRQRVPVGVSASLLGDAMHEIAPIADPLTKTSVQARFQAALQRNANGGPSTQPPSSQHTESRAMTSIQPQTRSSRRHSSIREAEEEASTTVVSLELLSERSSSLRRTLATARATGFAELR